MDITVRNVMHEVLRFILVSTIVFCMNALPDQAYAAKADFVALDSKLTSPTGDYRWLNMADQPYSETYRKNYSYTQAKVQAVYDNRGTVLRGKLTAANLKPNFAYQLKLMGISGTADNERIGLAGRWWQEIWDGSKWSSGANLNNKGDGSSPNPNDKIYLTRRDSPDSTSPTGKHYRYTGYLVFDYFITDDHGNASFDFEVNSSYHVLLKTSPRPPGVNDGAVKSGKFDPAPSLPAYDTDYDKATVGMFGEWERLPIGGVALLPGKYRCRLILTEESFHGSGGLHAGNWAAAAGCKIEFEIVPKQEKSSHIPK